VDHTRARLGETLVRGGLITVEQLERALEHQQVAGGKIGEVLVNELILTEDQVAKAIAEREGVRYVDLSDIEVDRLAVVLLPVKEAQRRQVVPIGFCEGRLVLAMADPLDVEAVDEAELWSRCKVEPVAAPASQVRYTIEKYGVGDPALQELESATAQDAPQLAETPDSVGDVPIVRVLNQLLREAVIDRASDVHFEPQEDALRVRSRIDGVLVDVVDLPKASQASLTSRLKVMADMDITERRRPQDGRIALSVADRTVDLRVATLPTPYGESIVVRVLDSASHSRSMDDLGLNGSNRVKLERMLSHSYGAILVAGPTGSGKTTTLYAALNEINVPTRKVITIEDPIEYRLKGLTQVAVNPKIGLTFAAGLRQCLRSDPDVVMVGEVRDVETAAIAVRSALTGHLVLSSIHTNDAPTALTRLSEMGVEPYISSSAIVGAIAQRLVRVLCPACRTHVDIPVEMLVAAGFTPEEASKIKPFGPVGCTACRTTGYRGRIGVFEIMEMDDGLTHLLLMNASAQDLREFALSQGMRSLRRDALDKVAAGVTSLEEVGRVLG
jgi:type IV pilus assembly protein PilB